VTEHGIVCAQSLFEEITMQMRTVGLVLGLVAAACSSTKVTSTWRDETGAVPALDRVLVVAVVPNDVTRQQLEEDFARELSKKQVAATPSHQIEGLEGTLDRDMLRDAVKREGFDGVLVVNYQGTERELEYVPTVAYYDYIGGLMSTPGYVRERTKVMLETRLFTTEPNERLVWSATTQTSDPDSSGEMSAEVAGEVVEKLDEEVAI
jgi:hypothetical protein